MPKKAAEKEQEVLGQIFDFIFKEAKKKPEKRKPIKTTGISGSSMLADGLAAALEKPGAFITETAAKDFNDALDVTLLKYSPDELNPHLSVKVSLANLPNIISDPMGAFQKTIDATKAARKEARANFLRIRTRELLSNAWARKYADLDTQQAVRLGLAAQNIAPREKKEILDRENWNMRSALANSAGERGNSDSAALSYMQDRAGTLIGRKVFTESKWNALTDAERSKYENIFALAGIKDLKDVKVKGSLLMNALTSRYGETEAKKRINGYDHLDHQLGTTLISQYGAVDGLDLLGRYKSVQGGNKSLSDPEFYRVLEISNLDDRINGINSRRAGMSPRAMQEADDQVNAFERAKILIAAHDLDAEHVNDANKKLKGWIKEVEDDIKTETDNDRKNELRKKLRELQGDSRQLGTMAFFGKVGQIEGLWGNLKSMTEGGLVTSILNGDFFDDDKNDLFRPSGKARSIIDNDIKFFVPAENKNAIIQAYNDSATQLYYLTPKSLIKTFLFNGEGFAYLMYKNKKKLDSLLKNSGLAELKDDKMLEVLGGDIPALMKKFWPSGVYPDGVEAQVAGLLKSYSKIGQWHKFCSVNARIKDKILNSLNKVRAKFREKIFNSFMKSAWFRKVMDGAAGKLFSQWVAKGSLQSLARGIVVALANALGLATTGGAANIIITALAMVLTDAIMGIAKVLFGIVVYAIIGIVGLLFLAGSAVNKFQKQTYTYASMTPGETYENPNFTPVGDSGPTGPIDGEIGDPDIIYNGTAQEIFQQIAAEMGITASLELMGLDHPHMAQMLPSWWCQSTSSGVVYCKAAEIAGAPSAYLSRLFRHELVHQIQGFAYPYFLSEWGADYLSGNGGGYTFYTRNGIQTATQTESYLLSSGVCTKANLEWVALTSSAAVNSPCGQFMQTYMSGYVQ